MSWPDYRRLRYTPTLRVPSDDGAEIAVEILGDGHDGPTIVFAHGWTLSSRFWHYQRALAERYRLVLADQRDHGESGIGGREHRTVDQLGVDLKAVLDATCAGRDVVLVGHSMGGMTIMSLAAHAPGLFGDQVRAVALLGTSSRRQPEAAARGLAKYAGEIWNKQWAANLALMSSDPELAEQKRHSGTPISVALSRYLNLGRGADRRLARFVEAMTAATSAETVGDFWLTLDTHDKYAALEALKGLPTLVIVGDRDRLTPPAHSREIAAAIPGARLLELRGAGHCAALEQPNDVNAALLELIDSVAGGRREATASDVVPAPHQRQLVSP